MATNANPIVTNGFAVGEFKNVLPSTLTVKATPNWFPTKMNKNMENIKNFKLLPVLLGNDPSTMLLVKSMTHSNIFCLLFPAGFITNFREAHNASKKTIAIETNVEITTLQSNVNPAMLKVAVFSNEIHLFSSIEIISSGLL
jgi:hypothetical protein